MGISFLQRGFHFLRTLHNFRAYFIDLSLLSCRENMLSFLFQSKQRLHRLFHPRLYCPKDSDRIICSHSLSNPICFHQSDENKLVTFAIYSLLLAPALQECALINIEFKDRVQYLHLHLRTEKFAAVCHRHAIGKNGQEPSRFGRSSYP